jgi:hypothetical protein
LSDQELTVWHDGRQYVWNGENWYDAETYLHPSQAVVEQLVTKVSAADSRRAARAMKRSTGHDRYHVYVVKLDDGVWRYREFGDANPNRDATKGCVYVGMTGLTPKERFANHKKGHKSGRGYVRRFGIRLMPELYEQYNPMSRHDAARMERELAQKLRAEGYAVWWN